MLKTREALSHRGTFTSFATVAIFDVPTMGVTYLDTAKRSTNSFVPIAAYCLDGLRCEVSICGVKRIVLGPDSSSEPSRWPLCTRCRWLLILYIALLVKRRSQVAVVTPNFPSRTQVDSHFELGRCWRAGNLTSQKFRQPQFSPPQCLTAVRHPLHMEEERALIPSSIRSRLTLVSFGALD